MIEDENYEICPYCGAKAYAEYVDNGIGYVQCTPHYCDNCGAVEIGFHCDDIGINKQLHNFYDRQLGFYGKIVSRFVVPKESSKISQEEFDKGWYKPLFDNKIKNFIQKRKDDVK